MTRFRIVSTPASDTSDQLKEVNAGSHVKYLFSDPQNLTDRLAAFRDAIHADTSVSDGTPSRQLRLKIQRFVEHCGINPGLPVDHPNYRQAVRGQALITIDMIIALAQVLTPVNAPSLEQLTQHRTALLAIKTQLAAGTVSSDELNILSTKIFKQPFLIQGSVGERINDIDQHIHDLRRDTNDRIVASIIPAILTGHSERFEALASQPVVVTSDELSERSRHTVAILHDSLFDGGRVSLPDQWMAVASRLLGVRVTASLLDMVLPAPALSEAEISQALDAMPEGVRTAMRGFLSEVTARVAGTDGAERTRWEAAHSRLHEAVTLLDQARQTNQLTGKETKIANVISTWRQAFQGTCSVGVDLRAMDCCGELRANIEGSEWTRQHQDDAQVRTMLQPVIIGRLQEMLCHTGIPVDYRTDVHHINLVMRLMYGGENRPIPEPLKDPFVPAYRATIESNARTIQRGFADPIWVLSAYGDNCIASNTPIPTWGDLPAKVPGIGIGPSLIINSEEKTKLLEAVFKQLSFEELRDLLQRTAITGLHLELGGHGLLGIAARVGRKDVVDCLRSSLGRSGGAVMPSLDRDGMGYTLMDYAVLGGNTDLATDVWNASDGTRRDSYLTTSAASTTVPSLMGLAGESGRAAMVHCVAAIAGNYTAPMITARDSEGNTALMRAAMSGNTDTLQAMIDQCVANQVGVSSILNHANSAGQTALILAIAHGKSAECVQVLLNNGADPNTMVASSGLSALEMVMMDGHLDILKALLEHPDIHISDRILTTVYDRDCTVALYSKALEREPELLSRELSNGQRMAHVLAEKNAVALRYMLADKDPEFVQVIFSMKDQNGNAVAHWLTEHNGLVLGEILAEKDAGFVQAILSIPGKDGLSVAHWLAEHNGAVLGNILTGKSDEFVQGILSITDQNGNSVAHGLAQHNGAALSDMLTGKSDEFVQGILSIEDQEGYSVAYLLAEKNAVALRDIVAGKSDEFVQGVLSIKNSDGTSVAHGLAHNNGAALRDILTGKSDEFVQAILSIKNSDGTSVAHGLAQYNGAALKEILAVKDDGFVRGILSITDIDGNSVAHYLALQDGEALKEILAEKNAGFVRDILLITNSNGTTVAHCLTEHNGAELKEILAVKDAGLVRDILSIADQEGKSVAHWLAQGDGAALRDILAGKDDGFVRGILSIPDQEGFSVAHDLARHNAEALLAILEGKELEFVQSILSIEARSASTVAYALIGRNRVALLDMLAGKDVEFVQSILSIADQKGRSFAHGLALINGEKLRELLADKDPRFVQSILSIADQKGWSVAHELARIKGAALKEILAGKDDGFVREILSIADQEGLSVAHWLAEKNAAALQELLADKDPGFVQGILSIQDASHRTVSDALFDRFPDVFRAMSPDVVVRNTAPPSGGSCVIS